VENINFFNKSIPVLYDVDCCILGGGTAGAPAAISALNHGAKTLVVEKFSALGGTQTMGMVSPMMAIGVKDYDLETNIIINEALIEEGNDIDDKHGNGGWFNGETLKYVLQKLILDRGGEILYLADLVDVIRENNSISYIVVNTMEGLAAIKSKTFIDASGDALLSRLSGVKVVKGDEMKGRNQSMTYRFEMGGIDVESFRKYVKDKGDTFSNLELPFFEAAMVFDRNFVLEQDFRKGIEKGELKPEDCAYFQCFTVPSKTGVMTFNCPEIPNSNNSTEAIKISRSIAVGREMIHRLVKFLVKNMIGFEKAYLSSEASMLGIRESYRIVGKYVLDAKDIAERRKFKDVVTKSAYPIDVHGVEGLDDTKPLKPGEYYEIPYRSLIVDEINNLIVAGRCISTSFLVQSSTRVQLTCRAVGEAAGKACAYSIKNNIPVNEIKYDKL